MPPRASIDAPVLDEELHVSSPLILVQYAKSGESAAFYSPISEPDARLSMDIPTLSLKPEAISDLESVGIRAIHIENQPGGFRFSISDESYPSLVWDDATRAEVMTLLADRGVDTGQVAGFLGLMSDLGVGLRLAMPSATASDLEISSSTLLNENAAAELLATARAVQPRPALTLTYDETGVPSGQLLPTFGLFGITHKDFMLSSDTIEFIAKQKIKRLSLTTTGSGLIVNVNDNELPYIVWTEDELTRLIEILPRFIYRLMEGDAWSSSWGLVLFASDAASLRNIILSTPLRFEFEFDF